MWPFVCKLRVSARRVCMSDIFLFVCLRCVLSWGESELATSRCSLRCWSVSVAPSFSGAASGSDITPVYFHADEEHLGLSTVIMVHNRCRKVRGRIHIAVLGIPLGHVEGCPIAVAHTLLLFMVFQAGLRYFHTHCIATVSSFPLGVLQFRRVHKVLYEFLLSCHQLHLTRTRTHLTHTHTDTETETDIQTDEKHD